MGGHFVLLFRQLLAKWGDSFAQFDFVLDQEQVHVGEVCSGFLFIEGGNVEWEFQAITIEYALSLYLDQQEVYQPIELTQLPQPLIIQPGTKNIFPFRVKIAPNALLSSEKVVHYFVIHVSVSGMEDHSERFQFQVNPSHDVGHLFSHLQQIGFQENRLSRYFDGYLQEFRFSVPKPWSRELEELRLYIVEEGSQLRLLMEAELFDYLPDKEVKCEWTLSHRDLADKQRFQHLIHQFLQEMIAHPYAFSRERYFYYQYHHPRLAEEPGAIGAQLAGKVSVDQWLAQQRKKEEEQRAKTQAQEVHLTKAEPVDEDVFRDIFANDVFDEDDD
jgi:sporulation-control protein spo0M